MNLPQRLVVGWIAGAAAVGYGAWWLFTQKPEPKAAEKPAPAANVTKVVKEDDLNTIVLGEEAIQRLGLTTGTVEKKPTRRMRVYGGEVIVPVGKAIPVTAPIGGVLKSPDGGMPAVGKKVKNGQTVMQLLPILTPDGRANLSASLVDAEGQVNNARTQVELARIALERSKRVLKEGAGSQRIVDESQAAFDLATKTLEAVTNRQAVLKKVVGDVEAGTAAPIPITAPEDGLLRNLSALPGQTVPGGGALFEVVDLSTVWLRVPIPVGDWDGLLRDAPIEVGPLAMRSTTKPIPAKPVAAPPSANPLAATMDLYFELPNAGKALIPGQRLGAAIPLNDTAEAMTVPWSAVVFDIHGGTWVYVEMAPRTYLRRRVSVNHTHGADAVLAGGLAAGTKVVVAGVQELFSAETGFVK